jgi:hypothetical protein
MPPHAVKGHWHGYWVKEPKDRAVLKIREESSRPYFVQNWILPYYVGDPDQARDPSYISNPQRKGQARQPRAPRRRR